LPRAAQSPHSDRSRRDWATKELRTKLCAVRTAVTAR
jgi:hypothetical protein